MAFRILDSLPGAGKTEYFVNTTFSETTDTLVYAAPSLELLAETALRVQWAPRKIYLCAHRKMDLPDTVTQVVGARVSQTLAELLGVYSSGTQAEQGSVILVSHEALLSLPRGKIAHRTHLFFDEARKCITDEMSVVVPAEMIKTFISEFGVVREKKIKNSEYSVCSLTCTPNKRSMDEMFVRYKSEAMILANLKDLLDKYIGVNGRERFEVKLLLPDTGTGGILRLFVFLRPVTLFEGFDTTTFLAAYFKDSQMYHLLRQGGYEFEMLTDDLAKPVLERSRRLQMQAEKRLRAFVLCNNFPRAVLTRNALECDVAVPGNYHTTITPSEFIRVEPKGNLGTFAAPLMWTLLREALVRLKDAPTVGLPIMVKNRASTVWFGRFNPSKSLELIMRRAHTKDSSIQEKGDVANVPLYWREYLDSRLSPHSKQRKVEVLQQVLLHGLNKYKDRNTVIHLAALNPSPSIVQFYKSYIPEYNYDADYTIDNVVQTLYRTSLRDPASTEQVNLAVATEGTILLLESKLGIRIERVGSPRIKLLRVAVGRRALVKGVKASDSPINKRINALRANLRYWKLQPDSEKRVGKLSSLELELASELRGSCKSRGLKTR